MSAKSIIQLIAVLLCSIIITQSCKQGHSGKVAAVFKYESFRDSILFRQADTTRDTSNLFDAGAFTPGVDSLDSLLKKIDTVWERDLAVIQRMDSFIRHIRDEEVYSPAEKEQLKENVKQLDSFYMLRDSVVTFNCTGNECLLFAEIVKSKQLLYLYIHGELKDSFKVSTGLKKKYETPGMSVRPQGPIFTKYTSRKFPGGNYKGLGNMPYVVFLRGGYAIHGTTPGNFAKLGTKASHGCIRLHPDNARVFYELVKLIGLNHTWVTVRDSL